jgi:hypothetical protein
MMHPEVAETRTLTIVLPESDWRALRAQEPDAIAWLQAQIRRRLDGAPAGTSNAPARTPTDAWSGDDY